LFLKELLSKLSQNPFEDVRKLFTRPFNDDVCDIVGKWRFAPYGIGYIFPPFVQVASLGWVSCDLPEEDPDLGLN